MQLEERKCAKCGVPLVRRPKEQLSMWRTRKYCSRACNAQAQRAWGHKFTAARSYRAE